MACLGSTIRKTNVYYQEKRMNVRSLIDEIKACLRNGSQENEVRRLGILYLEAHNQATRRLQHCIDLIREDKKSTALQEAMFSPPLMQVLEALSFPQQKQWSEALKRVGVVSPVQVDSKQLAMMGKLFSEPIDGSDPLYSDLAHAMRTKDAETALSILRLIRQKNPSDKNAVDQLVKIESSVQAKKIKNLLSQIKDGKDKEFSASFSDFEMEPWESSPEGLDWEEVKAHCHALRKAENLKRSKSMVLELVVLKQKNDWKNASELISQVDSVISANRFSLDENIDENQGESYKSSLESVRNWIGKEALKAKREEEDNIRENQLKTIVRSIQDKELGRKRKTEELRSDLAKLTSVGRDLEQVGQSLKEDDLKNFNRCLGKLRQEIDKRQKNFRKIVAASCVMITALAVGSFFLISERLRWNEQYQTLIDGLDNYKNAKVLEDFINSFIKKNPERIVEVEFETEINKARKLISEARSYNTDFGQRIQETLESLDDADDLNSIAVIQSRKKLLWEELNQVNIEYLNSRQDQLRELDLKWNIKRDDMQAKISSSISKQLADLSTFEASKLGQDQEAVSLDSNLKSFNLLLVNTETEAKKYSGIEGIGLTSGQKDILSSLRGTYEKKIVLLANHNKFVADLPKSDSVESLFTCLDAIVNAGISGSAEYNASRVILHSRNLFNDLEGRRFMPSAPQLWESSLDLISSTYFPQTILSKELNPFNDLFNDPRTINICSATFFSSDEFKRFDQSIDKWSQVEPESNRTIWTVGREFPYTLTFKRGRVVGAGSYILEQKAKVISGGKVTEKIFKSEWEGITKEFEPAAKIIRAKGEFILGGNLNPDLAQISAETKYLYSSSSTFSEFYSSGKISSPSLKFFDLLKNEPLDPFFKTRLFLKIFEVCTFRPHEWGLKNNPVGNLSIENHYKRLKDIVGGKDLIEEWYKFLSTNEDTKLRKDLISFYEKQRKFSYFKEAKFYEKFWKELLASKFVFEGYCTLDDDWGESIADYSWGMGKESGTFQILRRKGKEAMPFTPIMRLDKKLSFTLTNSRAYAGFESDDEEHYKFIKKSLPYPFNFFRENE